MFWTPSKLSWLFTVRFWLDASSFGSFGAHDALSGQVTKSTSQRLSRLWHIWFEKSVLECCPNYFFHFERRFLRRKFTFLSASRNSEEISISNLNFQTTSDACRSSYFVFIILLLKMASISAFWEKFRPSTVTICISLSLREGWNTISVTVFSSDAAQASKSDAQGDPPLDQHSTQMEAEVFLVGKTLTQWATWPNSRFILPFHVTQ